MKPTEFIVENSIIAQEADDMHRDHEVQMARSQLYSAAQAAIQIHRLLKNVSEMEGLEGWVQTKIAVASEYLESVQDYLKYEAVSQQSEMMPFAEEAADYALQELVNRKVKEQTATPAAATPTVGGMSKQGATTSFQQGPLSVTQTARPDQSTVKTVSYDMGPGGTATAASGIGFGGAGKDVQQGGNVVKSVTSESKAKLKEMATGGASSAGGMATSMTGPANKKTSGVPKRVGNSYKPKKVEVGKGVY